jgi:hypothetical protein
MKKLASLQFSPRSVPWLLLGMTVLTYGLLFNQLGFYWDEFPWYWTSVKLGPAALTQLFSTSRPFWGMLYQVTLPLVGPEPWRWQIIALVLRWASAVLVWAIVRQVWPKHPRAALWTSLLFLVYPGLSEQFIAMMYTHFYIILNCYLLSLYFSLLAIRHPQYQIPLTVAALVFSFINLLTMEYFYFVEAARPLLFWYILEGSPPPSFPPFWGSQGAWGTWQAKWGDARGVRRAILRFIPYFAVLLGISLWRAFFFENQNASYGYITLENIRANPLMGLWTLFQNIVTALWTTIPAAWASIFIIPDLTSLGAYTAIATLVLIVAAGLLAGFYLFKFSRGNDDDRQWAVPAILIGLCIWLVAGGSFWLVGIQPGLVFSGDRFNISFMLASALVIAGFIGLLWRRPKLQIVLLAVLIAFSAGKHFQLANAYRRDWAMQKNLFWQMAWRMPSITPGTTLLSNDLPVTFYSDNSLSGPLNWIYSPPGKMDYILYFASVRTQPGRALGMGLQPDVAFEQYYLSTTYYGNTSQMIVLNFEPPACLRVLDPEIDADNRLIPPLLRDAAFLSKPGLIRADNPATLPEQLYSPEPPHGWCYYFQKAELARGQADWQQVVKLAGQAFSAGDYPNDPMERFVFIEAYAHTGDWPEARKLTKEAYRISPEYVRQPLCRLWARIERDVADSSEKQAAVRGVFGDVGCAS